MDSQQQELVLTLKRILAALARQRATVSYRELAALAGVQPPHSIHRTTEALETLMRDNHAAGEPLLSALAVSRGAAGLPQRGFFMLLRELGRYDGPDDGPEAEAVFLEELELAWDYWAAGFDQDAKS